MARTTILDRSISHDEGLRVRKLGQPAMDLTHNPYLFLGQYPTKTIGRFPAPPCATRPVGFHIPLAARSTFLGELGDTAYRLLVAANKELRFETQLSVRETAKGAGEEEKEGGERTEEGSLDRDAPGAGGCRTAGQGQRLTMQALRARDRSS